MLRFNEATFVYVTQVNAPNGSPKQLSLTRRVKVEEVKTFSLNYYLTAGDSQRLMRLSKNLVANRWQTEDVVKNGNTYEFMYVDYQGKRYRVQQVLRQYRTNKKVLVDIQELR